MRTHYKPTETFQYTNYVHNSCHPADVKKGFVKGEALRLLRTNSSKVMFEENIKNFRTRLTSRGYPNNLVDKTISEVKFAERKNALTQTQKAHKRILPFVTQFHAHCSSVPTVPLCLLFLCAYCSSVPTVPLCPLSPFPFPVPTVPPGQ